MSLEPQGGVLSNMGGVASKKHGVLILDLFQCRITTILDDAAC